jgi:CRP/FNR family transcriptional regulator, anaerobic regulatory protein
MLKPVLPAVQADHVPPPFLPDEPLSGLFASRQAETFAPGQAVFWQGDQAVDILRIRSGCLRLFRVLPDGRRAITGFAFAGRVLGLAVRGRHAQTAEAVTEVKLQRLSARVFHAAVDDSPGLRPQVMELVCEEAAAAQEQSVMLASKKAEERLATFLVTTAQRTGADLRVPVEIELPMSRLDIADYVGLTIETVSRLFSRFKREGLITLDSPRLVRLRRLRDLIVLAGDLDDGDDFFEPERRPARPH